LGIHGLVKLQVVVDEEGNVTGAQVVSGDPVLTPAAVDAVMRWKFALYVVDGKPCKARTELQVFVGPTPAGGRGGIISSAPPAPGTAQMVRVSQSIMRGMLIHNQEPVYPENARAARIQGSVVLEAVIGHDGTIGNLVVVSGHPMLVDAALDAVRQWRYKPFLLSGQPVTVDTMITVNFVLDRP
jgi:protein TonB